MPDVWLGRFSRAFEKLFNAKGGPLLVDVNPSIQATLALDVGVETRFLQGWNRFGVFANSPPVAAQFSAVQWRNPFGSNVVAVFEQLRDSEGAADNPVVILKSNAADFGTGLTNQTRLDPRQSAQLPTLVGTKGSAAAQTGSVITFQATLATGIAVDFLTLTNQELVVAPGDALSIWGSVVNTGINVAAIWRERPLESSELA